jgi:IS30 family transposase
MVSIHDRPLKALGRQALEGRHHLRRQPNTRAVGTLVERKSRFLLLTKVDYPDAEAVRENASELYEILLDVA